MENKTLAQIIQNNIRVKNLEAESSSGDIVIYDDESGANQINDIALEIGAVYEIFVTSAYEISTDFGQQKITIKLIPAEVSLNNYDFYISIITYSVVDIANYTTMMKIYKYNTELWNISIDSPNINIYKIIKKAV